MATVKKAAKELDPTGPYLEQAEREGRLTKQTLSLKAVKPDTKYQARVLHLNMDHVKVLGDTLNINGQLHPVVVFEVAEGKGVRYILADGFHRHEAYRRAGKAAIPAFVIKGTERDAFEYATMCNRVMCLKRSKEDVKKAIYMLLEDSEWFGRNDRWIGEHVGASQSVVASTRKLFCAERKQLIPERLMRRDGRPILMPNRYRYTNFKIRPLESEEEEKARVANEVAADRDRWRKNKEEDMLRTVMRSLDSFFSVQGRQADVKPALFGGHAKFRLYKAETTIFATAEPHSFHSLVEAVGRLYLASPEIPSGVHKVVLVPYLDMAAKQIKAAMNSVGVTLLTLAELCERLGVPFDLTHPDSPATSGSEPESPSCS